MKKELRSSLLVTLVTLLVLIATAAASDTEKVLYNFAGGSSDGQLPVGGLVADASGNLYGTTAAGGGYGNCSPFGQTCGVVFQLTPGSGGAWSESVLYTFTGGADGGEPLAGLAIDANGNLYGTTALGGASGLGTVFMLSPNAGSWTESVLYSFAGGSDGEYPQSPVTLRKGNLYGMTYAGGGNYCIGAPSGCGVIFELVSDRKGGWSEKVLYQFTNGSDGAFPYANLVFDKAGNLYGTTTQGGYLYGNCAPYGCGNVFGLKHSSKTWSLLPLYAFTYDSDGSTPYGGVVFDAAGNMYGNTAAGGTSFYGTAFELKHAKSWKFSVIHTFTGPPDAGVPESAFVFKGTSLYGTSHGGGSGSGCFFGSPCGTVYKLTPAKKGWKSTVLHSFTHNGADGVYPEDSLIFGASGLLYATSNAGGTADQGTVFSIKP